MKLTSHPSVPEFGQNISRVRVMKIPWVISGWRWLEG